MQHEKSSEERGGKGGKREGSGRPKKGNKKVRQVLYLPASELDLVGGKEGVYGLIRERLKLSAIKSEDATGVQSKTDSLNLGAVKSKELKSHSVESKGKELGLVTGTKQNGRTNRMANGKFIRMGLVVELKWENSVWRAVFAEGMERVKLGEVVVGGDFSKGSGDLVEIIKGEY